MLASPRRALLALALLGVAPAHAQADVFPDLWVTDKPVAGMALLGDTLFLSGRFGYVGPPTGQAAALDKTTGEADLSWPRFESVDLNTLGVVAIVADGRGGYFVGGEFEYVGGEPRRNLARVRPDGMLAPAFRPDPRITDNPFYFGAVDALAFDPAAASPSGAGVLYVGGTFDTIGGQPREALAALDAATGAVLPLSVPIVLNDPLFYPAVRVLAVHGGVLYLDGQFDTIGGVERTSAALDAATGAVFPWDPALADDKPDFPAYATAFAFGDSTLYLSGAFDTVRGQRRPGLAEVSPADSATGEGGEPTPWVPEEGYAARDLVVVGNHLYAAAGNLVRVDRATGAAERLLPPPPGPFEGYAGGDALAFEPEAGPSGAGLIWLGCERRTPPDSLFADGSVPVVISFDVATGAFTGFEITGAGGSDPNRDVRALAVEPGADGRLLAGGSFTTLGGVVRRPGLAALDLTTGRPTDFPTSPPHGFHEDLALSPDGRFLYGYLFEVGGAALVLDEFDLATGAVRDFLADDPLPPPPDAEWTPRPVVNGPSALVATDSVLYAGLPAAVALDRRTAAVMWETPAAFYLELDNGDLLLVPDGGPGGPSGTLYVAEPLSNLPLGTPRTGFVALDAATGALLEWDAGVPWEQGAEGFAVARLDADGEGPQPPVVYFGGDRIDVVQGAERGSAFAVSEPTAGLVAWDPGVGGGNYFPYEPVMAMLAVPRRAEDGGGGVVYVGGSAGVPDSDVGQAMAFDAATGALLAWDVEASGGEVTTYHVRALLASPRHGALFVGGGFLSVLRGSGHAGVVAVTPAAPFAPVAGEPGAPDEAPSEAALALAGPNPFRGRTALVLALPEGQRVEVALYDVLGRRVVVLHDGPLAAGTHRLEVEAPSLPAGLYVARVSGEGFTASHTLTLVR